MAELRVTFRGLVAWVPRPGDQEGSDPRAYAVLLPDAQFAEPAPWSRAGGKALAVPDRFLPRGIPALRFSQVREPHTAVLQFAIEPGQQLAAVAGIDAVVHDTANQNPQAVVLLKNRRLTLSGLAATPLTVQKGGDQRPLGDLPHMAQIAPGHQWARAELDVQANNTDLSQLGLAGALEIDRGTLAVTKTFDNNRKVRFAAVAAKNGTLEFPSGRYKQPVGNQVTWSAPLESETVTLRLQDENGEQTIQLAPDEHGLVEISISNVELEVPVFRLPDAFRPEDRSPLPDADFGVFYPLSTGAGSQPMRFAVPTTKGATGSREKPCAPAVFSGFK